MRRRDALVIGGAVAIALAIPPLLRRRNGDFQFSDLPGLPGFRRLERGSLSAAPDVFAGLQTPREAAANDRLPNNLCAAVFPDPPAVGAVPVAVFSDYYCPYCAVLDRRLALLRDTGAPIDLTFHELPLLGDRSRWAARVALAATRQTDHTAIHLDMMQRVLRPGPAGVKAVAGRHGLDAAQLMNDAEGDEILAQMEDGLALGRALGMPGTPALMIGRTLVIGALPEPDLERIIALESEASVVACF
ncbi:DsbA family protein [Roseobacter sp. YSTF-M11]|uniref:DsbA family protein n=1 Tax=Roseobacter insulae TaxID=2859783 RepID=A0A9X1JXG0_9RHOB|nr:DsbA family protein [Roseobacter insulae]MBW4706936.1 DsbA family protein [Roseobacter insulae]